MSATRELMAALRRVNEARGPGSQLAPPDGLLDVFQQVKRDAWGPGVWMVSDGGAEHLDEVSLVLLAPGGGALLLLCVRDESLGDDEVEGLRWMRVERLERAAASEGVEG